MTELLDLVGLPQTLQSSLLEHLASEFGLASYTQGTARDGGHHGCNNDGFAVFGFLAFLLAAANLLMDDAAAGGGGRRKRSDECATVPVTTKQEGISATYSLFRGFLNALDAVDNECSNYFSCQGAFEAAQTGAIGQVLAKVGAGNAESWLGHISEDLHRGTLQAGSKGADLQPCDILYRCTHYPSSYRYIYIIQNDAFL